MTVSSSSIGTLGAGASSLQVSSRELRGTVEADVLKELVEYVARALVDNPDAVTVEAIEDEKTTMLRLKVAQSDLGRVIGKQGRTARAMRTLLHATAAKSRRRAVLEIVE